MLVLTKMNKLLKNKIVLIVLGIIVLVLVLGGIFLFVFQKSSAQSQNQDAINVIPTQIPIPSITADSLGLTLTVGVPGQTVIASITNTQGVQSIEYEFSYIAKGNITRGTFGKIDVTKTPAKSEITLGTCSDVCHYDQDVTNIKIVLKITKTDGKVYQSQAILASAAK